MSSDAFLKRLPDWAALRRDGHAAYWCCKGCGARLRLLDVGSKILVKDNGTGDINTFPMHVCLHVLVEHAMQNKMVTPAVTPVTTDTAT